MSLRSFHIVFVSICTMLFAFMVVWGLLLAQENISGGVVYAIIGGFGILLMPVYGVYFLRKANKMKL